MDDTDEIVLWSRRVRADALAARQEAIEARARCEQMRVDIERCVARRDAAKARL